MCGITGFLDLTRTLPRDQLQARITAMTQALRSRGPDDHGRWIDERAGVALGHRRLSILDLSAAGHQPMRSFDGRWWLVYNGEIYNHLELRAALSSRVPAFRGTSDTETLLAAIAVWGVAEAARRCRGIFAFAAFDTQTGDLFLVRDHLGVKPLYFGQQGNRWFFASELKAIVAHAEFQPEINRSVLPHYFRHNYIPGPYSIYQDIQKLPPGTWCRIDAHGKLQGPEPYWSFTAAAMRGSQSPLSGSLPELTDRLEAELLRVVGEQMLADVPLGAFLSGGIDSSLVVALMQRQSARPVKSFTIGFDLPDYNEAPFAAEVARHLGTDHTEFYVTSAQARDVIPLLPAVYDEPFADSSQIPTYLVSRLARQHVTVALSGDGGDELFCGYRRYFAALLGFRGGHLPAIVRHGGRWTLGAMGSVLPAGKWRKFCQRAATFLHDAHPDERYLRGMTHWPLSVELVRDAGELPRTDFLSSADWPDFAEPQQRWMWLDTLNYLPDDILVKVDRASMAVSLESRVPLLDPGIVELAWQLPHSVKADRLSGKTILKEVLSRHVPRTMFERPKMGFGIPIAEWLRGPLRDWGEHLLDPSRLQQEGFLHAAPVRAAWQEHQTGRVDRAYWLWDVLMFQAWLEQHNMATNSELS